MDFTPAPSRRGLCFEDSITVLAVSAVSTPIEWPSPYVNTFEEHVGEFTVTEGAEWSVADNSTILAHVDATASYTTGTGVPTTGGVNVGLRLGNYDTGTNSTLSMGWLAAEFASVVSIRKTIGRPLWSPLDYDHTFASDGNFWHVDIDSSLNREANLSITLYVVEIPATPY